MNKDQEKKSVFDESLDALRASDLAPAPAKAKRPTGMLLSTVIWILALIFLSIGLWASYRVIANLIDYAGAQREYDEAANAFSPLSGKTYKLKKLTMNLDIPTIDDFEKLYEAHIKEQENTSKEGQIRKITATIEDLDRNSVKEVYRGGAFRLAVDLFPADASEKYSMHFSDESVVFNETTGEFILPKSIGNALTILFKGENGREISSLTLSVGEPVYVIDEELGVKVSFSSLYPLSAGESVTFRILCKASGEKPEPTFTALNDSILLTPDGDTCTVTAVKAGNAGLTFEIEIFGEKYIYTLSFSVSDSPQPLILPREEEWTMTTGEIYKLDVATRGITGALIYSSSDERVARVSQEGLVTAEGAGQAVITIENAEKTASAHCTVTVNEENPPTSNTPTETPVPPHDDKRVLITDSTDPLMSYDKFISTRSDILQMRKTYSNNDILGWVIIPGAQIEYPLVQGQDNDYYLTHNHQKRYTNYGAIFMDYRNDRDLAENQMSFIYGHNIRNDSTMFNRLLDYKQEKRFNNKNYRYIYIYTDQAIYKFEVFSVYETDKTRCPTGIVTYPNAEFFLETINQIKNQSLYQREGLELYDNDRIVMLYTCANSTLSSERWLVFGVLVEVTK